MNAAGILVGGVTPALFLGLGTVLMRSSIGAGASIPTYLAVIGTTIALVGWSSLVLTGQSGGLRITAAVGSAVAMALAWSVAIACISYGFGVLKLPVAVVAPLTNANALVAVTVGALAFGEWRSLNLSMTTGGTLLIAGENPCVEAEAVAAETECREGRKLCVHCIHSLSTAAVAGVGLDRRNSRGRYRSSEPAPLLNGLAPGDNARRWLLPSEGTWRGRTAIGGSL